MPPQLHFQTLETEHMYLHYHDGYLEMAEDVANAGEEAVGILQDLLGHQLDHKVEVTLVDDTDDANGFAIVQPYPQVQLFVTAPDDISFLAEYDDWVFELIGHELLHIHHLDTTHGISKWVNWILGRSYFPNAVQSSWFIEGLAVEVETRMSQGGRVRSKLADMVFRAEQIAGKQIRLDQAVNDPLAWPQGTARYLHGGRFLTWVANKYGHDILKQISHEYGGELIPYGMNRVFKRVTGVDYDDAWAEFQHDLQETYAAQLAPVMEKGVREGRPLTHLGQYTYGPRFWPDGRIGYFTQTAMGVLPGLRTVDPKTGEDKSITQITSQGAAARPDARGRVIFSQGEVHKTFFQFNDLFVANGNETSGGRTYDRLTRGRRFREPDVSADGKWVYFVHNLGMRSRLMRAPIVERDGVLEVGAEQVLWDPPRHVQMYTPRVAPDGSHVAVSVHHPPGQRDIAIVAVNDAGSEPVVQWVTNDLAMDGGPVYSRDGALLYFHSARTGIFNIYAYRFADGVTQQVTNVLTGAFSPDPSVDDKQLAYLGYSERGYDVHVLDVAREAFTVAPPEIAERFETLTSRPQVERVPKPYSPWRTLVPWAWLPIFDADALGTVIGLTTGATDPLGRHSWAAEIGYGLVSNDLVYSLGYQNRQLYPLISVTADRRQQIATGATVINGQNLLSIERSHRFGVDVVVPFTSFIHQFQLQAGYQFDLRTRLTEYSFLPDMPRPTLPTTGNFAGLTLSAAYSNTRRTLGAVSTEAGQRLTISGTLRERWLGSDFRQGFLNVVAQHFQLMPWAKSHVVALRVAFSAGYSDTSSRALFQLGGLQIRDFVRDFIFGGGSSENALRGFKLAALSGNFSWLGNLEYRAPLWRIEHGLGVFPFYLRTLSAAVFVDAGNAAAADQLFRNVAVGVGGELRLEIDYGFLYGSTIRVGYARGLTKGGIHNVFVFLSSGF